MLDIGYLDAFGWIGKKGQDLSLLNHMNFTFEYARGNHVRSLVLAHFGLFLWHNFHCGWRGGEGDSCCHSALMDLNLSNCPFISKLPGLRLWFPFAPFLKLQTGFTHISIASLSTPACVRAPSLACWEGIWPHSLSSANTSWALTMPDVPCWHWGDINGLRR